MYVIHAGVYVIPAEMSIVIIPEVYPRVFLGFFLSSGFNPDPFLKMMYYNIVYYIIMEYYLTWKYLFAYFPM